MSRKKGESDGGGDDYGQDAKAGNLLDAVEFISANTPVSGRAALLFEECLRKSKLDYGNRDFDTSSMVEEALKAFSAQTGIKVELCAAPYQGEFKF